MSFVAVRLTAAPAAVVAIRLVSRRPLETSEARLIEAGLAKSFGYAFQVDWEYVDNIARKPGGKFEDVRSELA